MAPHERLLQKRLAKEMMIFIHGEKEYKIAVEASEVLFGKGNIEVIRNWDEKTFLSVFDGVPKYNCSKSILNDCSIIDMIAEYTSILSSKGEARRMLQSNAISVNKEKVTIDFVVNDSSLINGKYLIIQIGKKNYHLIVFS